MAIDRAEMFWTDIDQARERVQNTVVLYDGDPHWIDVINSGRDYPDGIPKVNLRTCDPDRTVKQVNIDDPKFSKFRELPRLGWLNHSNPLHGASFLYRVSRRTRVHGLSRQNVNAVMFPRKSLGGFSGNLSAAGEGYFDEIMYNTGFKEMHHGMYPSLKSVLNAIGDSSSIAFSNTFCVVCDEQNIKWLYRNRDKIGIFSGDDTLFLLRKYIYLREEIMDEERFTCNQIREL